MPKETINGDPDDRFVLDVGWNRDMDVQVGIRSVNNFHLVDEFYGEPVVLARIGKELRKRLASDGELATALHQAETSNDSDAETLALQHVGRQVLDAVTGSDYGMSSLWWNPGRSQINRLIRALRKARDAAFGSDA